MVEIKKLKIRRKIYHFDIKGRYQHIEHYKVNKRSKVEELRDGIKKLVNPPKRKGKKYITKKTEPAKGGFNIPLLIGAVLIALLLAVGGFMLIIGGAKPVFTHEPTIAEKATVYNKIISNDVLTVGTRGSKKHLGAVIMMYNTSGMKDYTVNITTYATVLPTEVFILNTERKEATSYPEFIRSLRKNLAKRKVVLNEINLPQLESIPTGALVIIPSGVMPQEMYGINSNIDMEKLMKEKGVVFVYMGQPFRSMLQGKLVVNTPTKILQDLPVRADETKADASTDGFSLSTPLYTALAHGSDISTGKVYGSVSIVKAGDGGMVVCPQTLDGGWKSNGSLAARDIARIVFETPWSISDKNAKIYVIKINESVGGINVFFTNEYSGTNRSAKIVINGTSKLTGATIEDYKIAHLRKTTKGEMYLVDGNTVVPTNLTAKDITIYADLKENKPALPSMYLIIKDQNNSQVVKASQGNMNVQAGTTLRFPVYQDTGEYVISLIDDESREYAKSYLKVESLEVVNLGLDYKKRSQYNFEFRKGGQPEVIKSVEVEVDDGKLGTYKYTDVSKVGIDIGQYTGGDSLGKGNYTFKFKIGTWTRTERVEVGGEEIPLELVVVLIFAGLIVGMGVIFARKEKPKYMLDIPDFPPISRTRIPLPSETILSIFEKVNTNYRWEFTPLTPKEIKNGFKDVFYKNKPIFITDYNVEYLMDELERTKLVKNHMEYYGPLAWEKKCNKTISYLTMLRRLRDICVNNAVPFTQMGESKIADSEVTVVGQEMYIHFYDKISDPSEMFKHALASVSKGISVILFKNEFEKEQFAELMNSPHLGPLILKMEVESSSVQLQTFEEFEKMLQDFKGV